MLSGNSVKLVLSSFSLSSLVNRWSVEGSLSKNLSLSDKDFRFVNLVNSSGISEKINS